MLSAATQLLSSAVAVSFQSHYTLSTGTSYNSGLWKVTRAVHKTTKKEVSIWVFEKKNFDGIRVNSGKERVLEVLKKEAQSLSRLRHPSLLEVVEPLAESRSELSFATEPLQSALSTAISSGRKGEELDEVEIQKGTIQVAKGLEFLHNQAKIIHGNLTPENIQVNIKGDWKISGLGLQIPLTDSEGAPPRWVFPEYSNSIPSAVQISFDYLAPEYALSEVVSPSQDLYSLGCILYAVHSGGRPPYRNHNSLNTLRRNVEDKLARGEWGETTDRNKLGSELKDLLSKLLTTTSHSRLTAAQLPQSPFFSNLAISTLIFLDRSNFSERAKEEKASFLRGLVKVLGGFSDRLRKVKILPSLLEELKDPWLIPFLLPAIFEIAKTQNKEEFKVVLDGIQGLFVLKEPMQNMLTLMDSIPLFIEKTSPSTFRESIMPLIYNSMESEHVEVQLKALEVIRTSGLIEVLDVGTTQEIVFVRVAILFSKTTSLPIKVKTLETFLTLISSLDSTTLTQRLVPLLSKIKTKEPSVMMATLDVQEAMSAKIGREAAAGLVLPQLWAMSMGPLLNLSEFERFMVVIKKISNRVEQEHSQHLRENHRIQSAVPSGNAGSGVGGVNAAEVDFESLVKGNGVAQNPFGSNGQVVVNPFVSNGPSSKPVDPWGDDDWGAAASIPTTSTPQPMFVSSPPISPAPTPLFQSNNAPSRPNMQHNLSTTSTTSRAHTPSRLGATPIAPSKFNPSIFPPDPPPGSVLFEPIKPTLVSPPKLPSFYAPTPPAAPQQRPSFSAIPPPPSAGSKGPAAPNYNIPPITAPIMSPTYGNNSFSSVNSNSFVSSAPPPPTAISPPGWQSGSVMQPMKLSSSGGVGNKGSKGNIEVNEFDPFA